jgi:carbon storage regulator CsrA
MLVLSRKKRESVVIGRSEDLEVAVVVTVLEITAGRVRLGFQSDPGTPIHRHEVWERIQNGDGHDGNGTGNGSPLLSNRLRVPS